MTSDSSAAPPGDPSAPEGKTEHQDAQKRAIEDAVVSEAPEPSDTAESAESDAGQTAKRSRYPRKRPQRRTDVSVTPSSAPAPSVDTPSTDDASVPHESKRDADEAVAPAQPTLPGDSKEDESSLSDSLDVAPVERDISADSPDSTSDDDELGNDDLDESAESDSAPAEAETTDGESDGPAPAEGETEALAAADEDSTDTRNAGTHTLDEATDTSESETLEGTDGPSTGSDVVELLEAEPESHTSADLTPPAHEDDDFEDTAVEHTEDGIEDTVAGVSLASEPATTEPATAGPVTAEAASGEQDTVAPVTAEPHVFEPKESVGDSSPAPQTSVDIVALDETDDGFVDVFTAIPMPRGADDDEDFVTHDNSTGRKPSAAATGRASFSTSGAFDTSESDETIVPSRRGAAQPEAVDEEASADDAPVLDPLEVLYGYFDNSAAARPVTPDSPQETLLSRVDERSSTRPPQVIAEDVPPEPAPTVTPFTAAKEQAPAEPQSFFTAPSAPSAPVIPAAPAPFPSLDLPSAAAMPPANVVPAPTATEPESHEAARPVFERKPQQVAPASAATPPVTTPPVAIPPATTLPGAEPSVVADDQPGETVPRDRTVEPIAETRPTNIRPSAVPIDETLPSSFIPRTDSTEYLPIIVTSIEDEVEESFEYTTSSRPRTDPERTEVQPSIQRARERAEATAGQPVVLSTTGLSKRFGSSIAVDGVSLEVRAGSFYGFVGPNGAGKTTTLSMITGLLRPTSGTVTILGSDMWANSPEAKRLVGALPDRLRLFDRLTGAQLLYYSGILHGLDESTVTQRAAELSSALGLENALGRLVSDYSAGMQKKIALATAMIHSPRILVLDEPFESIDPVSAATVTELLEKFVAGGGSVLISSHSMELIQRVCDHVAVIVQGNVVAAGTVDDVRGEGTLETRFLELTGPETRTEGLEWLHGFSD